MKPFGIVPSAPIVIGITIIFMFHSFFKILKLSLGTYLSSLSFIFFLFRDGKNILHCAYIIIII